MRFGALPLAEAEDAILAHSVRLRGLALKKGRRLTADDLEALRAAGRHEVVAAKLDADDVGENEAAARLAPAIAGPNVRIERPFTGRVNLFAERAGLIQIDRSRLDQLNGIDEAITIGTLPHLADAQLGQMVATIKIIPFAVPEALLERAITVASGAASGEQPALRIAPYRPLSVTLIQTRLSGLKESVLDKTVTITAGRIAATGGRLIGEVRCPHEVPTLAERIRESRGDVLMIAGASAITDRRDVLPAAIEAAGGEIDHFGMPVDPGNLLLLAHLEQRPVLGLPGCCRSPKLNGFDWVWQRIAAGVGVSGADIMKMGVGGLLMEIPSRPQPRAGTGAAAPGKVAAIVLAAGQSRRMGRQNKLLLPIDGRPMVAHVVDAALASRAAPVIVVTGHQADELRRTLADRPVQVVHNPLYVRGLSTSMRAGLRALPEDATGVLIGLGDMPRVSAALIDRLIAAFDPASGRAIVVPTVRGKRGNPVLFATRFVPQMLEVEGDVGARHLIGAHDDEVMEVEMDDDASLLDVDTPEAMAALADATP